HALHPHLDAVLVNRLGHSLDQEAPQLEKPPVDGAVASLQYFDGLERGVHTEHIGVEGAGEVHGAFRLQHRHEVPATGQRRDKESVRHRLAERREVGGDAKKFLCSTKIVTEPCLDLVEYQDGPVVSAELAKQLEVAGLEGYAPHALHDGLDHDGGSVTSLSLEIALEDSRSIGRQNHRLLHHLRQCPWRRHGVGPIGWARVIGAGRDAHGQWVGPPVLAPLELHNLLAPRERPGAPDRVATRITAAPTAQHYLLRAGNQFDELTAQVDLPRVWETQVRSLVRQSLDRRLQNFRMVVAKDARSKSTVQVDVLVTVDIPQTRAGCPREVE